MKKRTQYLILSACTFILFGHFHFALADTSNDAETLFNWAETNFPQFFPTHQGTQSIDPWLYRFYPDKQIYIGVNKTDNNVYVLGGSFGNDPKKIDSLTNLISQINNSGGNSSIAACDTSKIPAGISYSQSGTVVTVSTNGACVPAPDLTNTNLCQVPKQNVATGISTLGTNTITSSAITGLAINIPGLPDPIKGIVDAAANVKHCTNNAPAETANLVINSDLCFDITSAISALISGFPGVEMTPPVNYLTKGTYTSQIVADCFATDATTVSDAVTGEIWIKQNGSFIKIGG
ncbi:MAG: hypothetical protein DYH15_06785 [Nitrosomonas sp. PRO4]|nr:hypothetical protein [Nitrosomonas sp. PRO4]